MSESTPIKEEARLLVEELPEDATWSDFARLVSSGSVSKKESLT